MLGDQDTGEAGGPGAENGQAIAGITIGAIMYSDELVFRLTLELGTKTGSSRYSRNRGSFRDPVGR